MAVLATLSIWAINTFLDIVADLGVLATVFAVLPLAFALFHSF